ncbi:chaperone Ric-8A-like isoform X1 [Ptychodera flava]|uniref:chaperone Ric-8A-like isoform X1 n=1 Tax=Ptychodera flava TaxID=63121 RepID=UPI003969D801
MEELVRSMLSVMQTGNEEDISAKFQEFNKENASTFTFDFNEDLKKGLIQGILDSLTLQRSSECHAQCLETLRIFSRDKFRLHQMTQREGVSILLGHAGLDQDGVAEVEDKVKIEAQKCLCNLVYNSSQVQKLCSSSMCIDAILRRMTSYKDPKINQQIKFFDMRMLFLLTALCPETRNQFKQTLSSLRLLVDALDATVHGDGVANDNITETESDTVYIAIDDSDADLAMEILKTLFNVTMTAKKGNLDQGEEMLYVDLGAIIRRLLLSKTSTEDKTETLHSHTVNLLTNMPMCAALELTPKCPEEGAVGGKDIHETYKGHYIDTAVVLKQFLVKRVEKGGKGGYLVESLSPVLSALHTVCKYNRIIRKYLRSEILPPLRDASTLPEEGETIRNKLVRLMTNPSTEIKDLVADFLFVLCKENVDRLIKYTGYGNAAGLLCQRGLMGGAYTQNATSIGGNTDESSSDDSDTEEYMEVRHKINPITGRVEDEKPNPTEGWTEEQKEFHANQLANMFDKLSREGVIKPMTVGPDGRPIPLEEAVSQIEIQEHNSDSELSD